MSGADQANAISQMSSRLLQQAKWCRDLGSPLYADLLESAAIDVEEGGPAWDVLVPFIDDPAGSAIALRLMGAVHRLVLEGRAPGLGSHYPSVGGTPGRAAPHRFRETLQQHRDGLEQMISQPVQTNEVGRSAALIGGFLQIVRETGLPLSILEIGASAGLNLRWDNYYYETPMSGWGDPSSAVVLKDFLTQGRLPFDTEVKVIERRGCDVAPLDPSTRDGASTLASYVWADQVDRLALLRGAIKIATRVPAPVDEADASDWLKSQLAYSRNGVATVVFHSIVLQYIPPSARERVVEIIKEAGLKATSDAPVAWLRMEPGEEQCDVHMVLWPDGGERHLARSGHHGRPVRWLSS